jgi:hypothetical protein
VISSRPPCHFVHSTATQPRIYKGCMDAQFIFHLMAVVNRPQPDKLPIYYLSPPYVLLGSVVSISGIMQMHIHGSHQPPDVTYLSTIPDARLRPVSTARWPHQNWKRAFHKQSPAIHRCHPLNKTRYFTPNQACWNAPHAYLLHSNRYQLPRSTWNPVLVKRLNFISERFHLIHAYILNP